MLVTTRVGWIIVVLAACKQPADNAVASGSGSAGSAVASPASGSSASPEPARSAASVAAPKQAAALDDLDRWLAPIGKLAPRAQMDFLCPAIPTLRDKSMALTAMGPPIGVDPVTWKAACETLHGSLEGVGLCCNSYGFYEKPPKPHGDEDAYSDCMKNYPDAFAAVVKLVPGAKPLGVHAGEPLMPLPKQ